MFFILQLCISKDPEIKLKTFVCGDVDGLRSQLNDHVASDKLDTFLNAFDNVRMFYIREVIVCFFSHFRYTIWKIQFANIF